MENSGSSKDLFFESMYRLFKPIAVSGVAVALLLITLNLFTSDDITLAAAFGMSDKGIEEFLETPLVSVLEE